MISCFQGVLMSQHSVFARQNQKIAMTEDFMQETPQAGTQNSVGIDSEHAVLHRHNFNLLKKELSKTNILIEESARDLTQRFMTLASCAQEQTSSIVEILNYAGKVDVDGKRVPFTEIVNLLDHSLQDFVEKVVFLSKQAMTMVHTLDSISDNLDSVEHFVTDIDDIARKTTFLALNARIEAEHAGAAGKTFTVVASEVRELSKQTAQLAEKMQSELGTVTHAIRDSHGTLQSVASMDLTDTIMVKENLDRTLSSLGEQNQQLSSILQNSLEISEDISKNINHIITDVQYQDRTSQRLTQLITAIDLADDALEGLMKDPEGHMAHEDISALKKLQASSTLSPTGKRLAEFILNFEAAGGGVAPLQEGADYTAASDDIELF